MRPGLLALPCVLALAGCGRGCGEQTADTPSAEAPAPAPEPAAALPHLAPAGHRVVDVAPAGPRGVRILFADEAGRGRLCEATQPSAVGLPLDVVRCEEVDPAIAIDAGARVVPGVEANAPAVLVVPGRGLVEARGRRWTDAAVVAAEADARGLTAIVEDAGGATAWLRLDAPGAGAPTPLDAPADPRVGPALADGAAYWIAGRPAESVPFPALPRDSDTRPYGVRPTSTGPMLLRVRPGAAPEALGAAPAAPLGLRVCRSAEDASIVMIGAPRRAAAAPDEPPVGTAAAAAGPADDGAAGGPPGAGDVGPGAQPDDVAGAAAAVAQEAAAAAPAPPARAGDAPAERPVAVWFPPGEGRRDGIARALLPPGAGEPTCRPGEVVWTWSTAALPGAFDRPVLHELRCRAERCVRAQNPLGIAGTDPIVVEFAERALVAWTAADGTRLRIAPLVQIDRAPDVADVPGPDAAPLWRHLVARGGGALVLEGRPSGVLALRLDATGAVDVAAPTMR